MKASILSCEQIGKVIKFKRNSMGLSRENVALELGISTGTLSNLESSKKNCSFKIILEVCNFLNLSIFCIDNQPRTIENVTTIHSFEEVIQNG